MNYSKSLKPVYERFDIPTADRAKLTRYFNKPNGIPKPLRHYFIAKEYKRFFQACLVAITGQYLDYVSAHGANQGTVS